MQIHGWHNSQKYTIAEHNLSLKGVVIVKVPARKQNHGEITSSND